MKMEYTKVKSALAKRRMQGSPKSNETRIADSLEEICVLLFALNIQVHELGEHVDVLTDVVVQK